MPMWELVLESDDGLAGRVEVALSSVLRRLGLLLKKKKKKRTHIELVSTLWYLILSHTGTFLFSGTTLYSTFSTDYYIFRVNCVV